MPILCILCYNGSSVTWTVVSLTTVKFKPLIFSECVVPLVLVIQLWVKLYETPPPTAPLLLCDVWARYWLVTACLFIELLPRSGHSFGYYVTVSILFWHYIAVLVFGKHPHHYHCHHHQFSSTVNCPWFHAPACLSLSLSLSLCSISTWEINFFLQFKILVNIDSLFCTTTMCWFIYNLSTCSLCSCSWI
jgi:hypothetical protein